MMPKHLATVNSLIADLRKLGIVAGMTLLVHSSLRALGWVCGGPVAVILALEKVLTPQGTLVMPTHTSGISDPSRWCNPPVPPSWWDTIRETMPAYDPSWTPSQHMGTIAECFRKQPGVLRSNHPQVSFAAWGKHAQEIVSHHNFEHSLGENSPLSHIYRLCGWVFLLGVGHEVNTSLHLAEYRADYPWKNVISEGAPVIIDGQRQWLSFADIELDSFDFAHLGDDFTRDTGMVKSGKIAQAVALLMPQRDLVDYGTRWLERNRLQQSTTS